MMMSEFIELTGFEPTGDEYSEIEAEYMNCNEDKQVFCKNWKKNGGIQRLCRLRVARIDELERQLRNKDRDIENRNHEIIELKSSIKTIENMVKEKDEEIEGLRHEYTEKDLELLREKDRIKQFKKAFEALLA